MINDPFGCMISLLVYMWGRTCFHGCHVYYC